MHKAKTDKYIFEERIKHKQMVESEDFRIRNRARYQEFLDSLPHVLTDIEADTG